MSARIVEGYRAARVAVVSRQSFDEYFEISVALECLALKRAAERIGKPLLAALRAEVEDMARAIQAGETEGYARRFDALLMRIYQVGDSPALIGMIENVRIKTAPPSRAAFEERGIVLRLNAALLAVLEALDTSDAARAADVLAVALTFAIKGANLFPDMDHDGTLKPTSRSKTAP